MAKKIRGYVNGEYLKELRKKHNLTPIQTADKLGVGLSTYYKWEGNKQAPSILKMQLLQILYKELDYNELLSIGDDKINALYSKKCYNSNCINRERGNNEK